MKKQHLSSIGQVKGTGTWAPASRICVCASLRQCIPSLQVPISTQDLDSGESAPDQRAVGTRRAQSLAVVRAPLYYIYICMLFTYSLHYIYFYPCWSSFLPENRKKRGTLCHSPLLPFISLSTTFYDSNSRTRIGFQRLAQSLWRIPLSWTCSTWGPGMISQPPPQISSHLCVCFHISVIKFSWPP